MRSIFIAMLFISYVGYSQENESLTMHMIREENQKEPTIINQKKPKIIKYPDNSGAIIKIEFLYWMVKNNAAVVATKETVTDDASIYKKVERVNFKFEPGFRLGLGYNSTHDEWDIYAYWTYIHSNVSKTLNASNDFFLIPVEIDPDESFQNEAYYSKGSWLLKYNRWDLEMGRYFYPGKYFSLRPNFGLIALIIDQKFTNTSKDINNFLEQLKKERKNNG